MHRGQGCGQGGQGGVEPDGQTGVSIGIIGVRDFVAQIGINGRKGIVQGQRIFGRIAIVLKGLVRVSTGRFGNGIAVHGNGAHHATDGTFVTKGTVILVRAAGTLPTAHARTGPGVKGGQGHVHRCVFEQRGCLGKAGSSARTSEQGGDRRLFAATRRRTLGRFPGAARGPFATRADPIAGKRGCHG